MDRASTDEMDPVPPEAARAVVWDLEGKPHELQETWATQTVVLAFVRHFG